MQLFDNFGRYCGVAQPSVSARIRLEQPEIDYESVLTSLYSTGLPSANAKHPFAPMWTDELQQRTEAIQAQIRRDSRVSNILNGVQLPLLLKQLPERYVGSCWDRLRGRSNDYGTLLRDAFLPAVKKAHWLIDPQRQFINWLDKTMAHQLTIAPESRHDQLVERMSKGCVVGTFFPMAFAGFSALQCRQLMATLPENFVLSGGFDLATALISYPKLLMSSTRTPELTMAALNWRKCSERLVSVKTWSEGTTVSNEADVSYELASFSAGLLVLEDTNH